MRGIEVLMRLSALSNSEHAQTCVDIDRKQVDITRLGDWPWSTGESILVDLVGAIYNGRPCQVGDLTALDNDNRRVAVMALGAWLVEPEEVYL
jgi:hypothetical protein